jgi:hypothetical protein
MKANRFQNGYFQQAKEGDGEPSLSRPDKTAKSAPQRCATPVRSGRRARPARALGPLTTVTAKIDVGFGNTLFIRGEGEGLSWDKGQPLVCVEGTTWIWSTRRAKEQLRFKLLVNDQLWSRGENLEVAPGTEVQVVPAF